MIGKTSLNENNKVRKKLRDYFARNSQIVLSLRELQREGFFSELETDDLIIEQHGLGRRIALASALNAAGQKTVNQIKCGNLDQVIIKGTEGFVILQNLDNFIVLAASKEIYSLALAMNVLGKYGKNVYQILTS